MDSGVYKISNKINDKIYIGSAAGGIANRWRGHKHYLSKGMGNRKMQPFYNKYGWDSLIFEVLEYCPPEYCIKKEQWYIDVLKPWFNASPTAGSPLGVKHSEEAKEKNRQRQIGKKMSEEAKNKISLALKGRNMPHSHLHTKEAKEKASIAKIGVKRTDEARKNMSDARKAANIKTMLGKSHREDSKKKIRESNYVAKYTIQMPSFEIVEANSIKSFAKQHGLSQSALIQTFTKAEGKKHKAHKGYKVLSITPLKESTIKYFIKNKRL